MTVEFTDAMAFNVCKCKECSEKRERGELSPILTQEQQLSVFKETIRQGDTKQ